MGRDVEVSTCRTVRANCRSAGSKEQSQPQACHANTATSVDGTPSVSPMLCATTREAAPSSHSSQPSLHVPRTPGAQARSRLRPPSFLPARQTSVFHAACPVLPRPGISPSSLLRSLRRPVKICSFSKTRPVHLPGHSFPGRGSWSHLLPACFGGLRREGWTPRSCRLDFH